ncbi:885_t:CDS:2 [Entrophospora sp. SA101]|nr:885_t:CDS:2 [Entrophospora sp. SA101]
MAMNKREKRMNLQSQSNSDTIKSNGNLERQIALLEKRIELNLKKSKLILKIKRDDWSTEDESNTLFKRKTDNRCEIEQDINSEIAANALEKYSR